MCAGGKQYVIEAAEKKGILAVQESRGDHRISSTAMTHSPPASAHLIELPSLISANDGVRGAVQTVSELLIGHFPLLLSVHYRILSIVLV